MIIDNSEVEKLIKKIAQDNRSGATALTELATKAFDKLAEHTDPKEELSALRETVLQVGTKLLQAKPIMGSIFNLASAIITRSRKAHSSSQLLEIIMETTDNFRSILKASHRKIAQQAASQIENKYRVMTISYSSLVLEALKKAKQEGKEFEVICPESRPIQEGIEFADELTDLGISTTVVVDCLAPTLLGETDLVLIGGDALSYSGLVNKAGTYMLAEISQVTKTKVVALLSTQKFIPINQISKLIGKEDPSEIVENPPSGVNVLNRYFDVTPLNLISQVITEKGRLSSDKLTQRLDEIEIDEKLKLILEKLPTLQSFEG